MSVSSTDNLRCLGITLEALRDKGFGRIFGYLGIAPCRDFGGTPFPISFSGRIFVQTPHAVATGGGGL